MDDLLGVEVEHAASHLPAPPDHLQRQDLRLPLDVFIEGPPGAELHDNTVTRGLGAHTPVSVDVCVEGGGGVVNGGRQIMRRIYLQPTLGYKALFH